MAVTFEFSAPIEEPSEAMAALRQRIASIDPSDNAIQHEAYYLALSAAVWRLVYFGVEDTFQLYTPRDMASFSMIAEGQLIDLLVRTAYTRALVEDDAELCRIMGECGVAAPVHAWHQHLLGCDEAEAVARLANAIDPEERAAIQTIIARRFPGQASPEWLWQVPANLPTVCYALARALLSQRGDLAGSIGSYLASHREVLLAREPDPLLSMLVAQSAEHPQVTLAPFEGIYGEETVVAAAAWHLEHNEPAEAIQLAAGIRPLCIHSEQAALIGAIAAVQVGRADQLAQFRSLICGRNAQAQLTIRLGESDPRLIRDEDLVPLMDVCLVSEPELFYRALRLLLARKRLDLARQICARRQGDYQDHPELSKIIAAVLARG